jgi:ubiquinone/menaquinone biosynthesis C-methylase UbiE
MKRVPTAELLDTDSGTAAEISQSFSDLRRINRWFGGNATTQAVIEHVAGALKAKSPSLLEVAAGSGDVVHVAQRRLRTRGIDLEITLLDRAPSHLNNRERGCGSQVVVGDALALPFGDESFDLVGCSLFTHHLAPNEFVQFVNEGLRVCRSAVLINDLVRDARHLALVYAGTPLFRGRLTRHDAVASVRQAYTAEEMRAMLQKSRAARIEIRRHFLFRMAVVIWKHPRAASEA